MNLSVCKNLSKLLSNKFAPCTSIRNHRKFSRARSTNASQNDNVPKTGHTIQNTLSSGLHFQNTWPPAEKAAIERDMIIVEDFISEAEEQSLIAEAEKSLKRKRYEYDHWDDAIHGFREMEKVDWLPENRILFDRVRQFAFVADIMPHVHILDLAKDGIIKPHVDSSRFCGTTIAGLSLLTDCIMRLRRVDETKYVQPKVGESNPPTSGQPPVEYSFFVDALLKRRSLYVMKDTARYNFTHEVLASNAEFDGIVVEKGRRVSIICRNEP